MPVIINTNSAATVASNNLAASNTALQRSLNRLSSGSKIVNPADDAGGLAVSMKLSAVARRQGAVFDNIANATSLLQTQDGVLSGTGKILNRISELKVLNNDVTKSASDRANYQSEFAALQAQISANATEKFNGVSLFGSNSLTVGTTENAASSVTAQGVNLVGGAGTPAFATITDNFTDLSQWTNQSMMGCTATATSNTLVFGGSLGSSDVLLNPPVSGAYEINFDLKFDSGADPFTVLIHQPAQEALAVLSNTGTFSDAGYHHVRITVDASGNTAFYLNNSSTASGTGSVGGTAGQINLYELGTSGANIKALSVTSTPPSTLTNIGTVASAGSLSSLSLSTVSSALQDLATHRAKNGANQSQLGFSAELLTVNKANLEAATSRITDVDVAQESTVLARNNVLVSAGTSMLSQANQSSQIALKLLS